MSFKINNRRYTGSKFKLSKWIKKIIETECVECNSFCDIFAGTGVVSNELINNFNKFLINDFLFSNMIIYEAFFSKEKYDNKKLYSYYRKYQDLESDILENNYVSDNFGNKYFSMLDARKIGYIREDIEKNKNNLNRKEYCMLIASLIYSFDRCANTVGHYEAFLKNKPLKDQFNFELIEHLSINENTDILITKEDANKLAYKISYDIIYIDPPYSSRQYSRFYHVIETIAKWDKPSLYGVAMKPKPENMSKYCTTKAIDSFKELIATLQCKYIIISYNNTYTSKSRSSENKMTLDDMLSVLNKKGETKVFETTHPAFNAGKTDFNSHKEFLFLTKVGNNND